MARAFFVTAAWVLNVGATYVEWVSRHTFRLLAVLAKKFRRSYFRRPKQIIHEEEQFLSDRLQ